MYNKAKRILSLIAGILCIVVAGLEFVCAMCGFNCLVDGGTVFLTITSTGFGVVLLIFGIKLVKAPKKVGDSWETLKGIRITLMVLLGCTMLISAIAFEALALNSYYVSLTYDQQSAYECLIVFKVFVAIVAEIALPVNIVAICLKTERTANTVAPQPVVDVQDAAVTNSSNASIEEKIKQLKGLLDMGAITEEQYKNSVDKLVKDLIN